MFFALAMFILSVFTGCESDHHQRNEDRGYPGPSYEQGSHHENDWNRDRDRDWDYNRH